MRFVKHVYKHQDDNRFYAVFSTSMNGFIGSAICTFSLQSIQEAFNGKFKTQDTWKSLWLPVFSSQVPEPRPGVCVNDSQSLSDSVLNFIRGHPLMDSAVAHDNGKPVFYKRDVVFTRLVVDRLEVNGVKYFVYYAGTNTGLVYKLIEWFDQSNEMHSYLADIFDAFPSEPIRAIEISPKYKSLYVSSDNQIRQFDLSMCEQRYESCVRCVRDPYCGWDKYENKCKPYSTGYVYTFCYGSFIYPNYSSFYYRLLQDANNSAPGLCSDYIKHEE
ncbi:semaphorin-2A-like protein, partial [Dinothrombium tinctorium]